jgi:hypothetical protein
MTFFKTVHIIYKISVSKAMLPRAENLIKGTVRVTETFIDNPSEKKNSVNFGSQCPSCVKSQKLYLLTTNNLFKAEMIG